VQLVYTFTDVYSASTLRTMQTAVIVRAILSVRPSVTFRCFVQKNEDTIVWFSALGRKIILVSGDTTTSFSEYSQGYTPSKGVKVKLSLIASKN